MEETQEQIKQESPNLTININLDELNFVISKLAKDPYEEVAMVIDKIRYQAFQQLQALNTPPATPAE